MLLRSLFLRAADNAARQVAQTQILIAVGAYGARPVALVLPVLINGGSALVRGCQPLRALNSVRLTRLFELPAFRACLAFERD